MTLIERLAGVQPFEDYEFHARRRFCQPSEKLWHLQERCLIVCLQSLMLGLKLGVKELRNQR